MRSQRVTPLTGFVIGALVVAVGVLGYLYYAETQDDVSIKLDVPNLAIEKN